MLAPPLNVIEDTGLPPMLSKVTVYCGAATVMLHDSETPSAVAVTMALPAPTATTLPVLSTVATPALLLAQMIFGNVVLPGCNVAPSVNAAPGDIVSELLLSTKFVTWTGAAAAATA